MTPREAMPDAEQADEEAVRRADAEAALLMASALASCQPLGLASLLAAVLAGIVWPAPHPAAVTLLLLVLASQALLGWRLQLDAGYFRLLGHQQTDCPALDAHLQQLFARPPRPDCPLAARLDGTRRLMQRYLALTAAFWLGLITYSASLAFL
ncbi:hypothetical protein [Chitinilyticum litopenaei]|uniref:hypothetical protein n=1 Tax=Chitinilyticum litopenaei TaxID=1121276 RepID=UPI0004276730|nr:hypothetical protein [Chitinilyticum litopenaei]